MSVRSKGGSITGLGYPKPNSIVSEVCNEKEKWQKTPGSVDCV